MPTGFQHGVEVLNDNTTPMEVVVTALSQALSLSYTAATRVMLEIHDKGGKLIPTSSRAEAEQAAERIVSVARLRGHTFGCRAVSVE